MDNDKRLDRRMEDMMSAIPSEVSESFTDVQLTAIKNAISRAQPWRLHPIDVRTTFPLFGRRIYVTLLSGIDSRSDTRRREDRQTHPMRTASNMLFLGAAVVGLYAIAGIVALIVALTIRN